MYNKINIDHWIWHQCTHQHGAGGWKTPIGFRKNEGPAMIYHEWQYHWSLNGVCLTHMIGKKLDLTSKTLSDFQQIYLL